MDGSFWNGKVGIGVFSRIQTYSGIHTRERAKTIGPQSGLTAQYAELAALEEAVDLSTYSWGQVDN